MPAYFSPMLMSCADKLAVIVLGGSGDLARKKIYPALFALYCQDRLPGDFAIFGFARSEYDRPSSADGLRST